MGHQTIRPLRFACLLLIVVGTITAAETTEPTTTAKEHSVTHHATGTFEVKLSPQSDEHSANAPGLGRLLIDKTFEGDLLGTSKGQMLSARTEIHGSAGYVAVEQVEGTLAGRTGTFVLQHNATMDRGTPALNIVVVPDSATGALAGLTGSMTIRIEDGEHFYDLAYTFVDDP